MKRLYLGLTLGLTLGLACGDSGDDDSDSGNDSANDSAPTSSADVETSSSMETCNSNHNCVGGSCQCTTPGKEGEPCDDETACEEQCEVCM